MIDLVVCAERLQGAPHRTALLQAWLRWRGVGLLPTTDAVRVEDLGSAMGYTSVLEIHSPELAIFRLVGDWYDRVAGRALLGENFIDLVAAEERPIRGERCWNMAAVPCGMMVVSKTKRPSGQALEAGILVLPVRPAAPGMPIRLYHAVDVELGYSLSGFDAVDLFPVPADFDYIDIGCGLPE